MIALAILGQHRVMIGQVFKSNKKNLYKTILCQSEMTGIFLLEDDLRSFKKL